MDTKKLLGTIIGVIMFALLIVGATYAWLTVTANVTNGNYTIGTKTFIINYKGDEQGISNTIQALNPTISEITSETDASSAGDGWLAVTASKAPTSAPAKEFAIKLHINSISLTTKALTYAVCQGDCPSSEALATVSDGTAICGTGVIACGTVDPAMRGKDIILYNDTSTFNYDGEVGEKTYNIYFWLDAGTLVSADIGKSFGGYIHASATQGDQPSE